VHQAKYTKDILKKFKMDDSKPMLTPMYDYNAGRGRGRRDRGPEGVPEHDRLPLVLDGDETGHSVLCVFLHSLSGVTENFTSTGRQADLQVSSIHS
jgi:hypothetical protein